MAGESVLSGWERGISDTAQLPEWLLASISLIVRNLCNRGRVAYDYYGYDKQKTRFEESMGRSVMRIDVGFATICYGAG